jgi:hypothetical protein
LMECVVRSSRLISSATSPNDNNNQAFPKVGTFPIEDVYTAVLAKRCGGVCLNDSSFYLDRSRRGHAAIDRYLVMHKVKDTASMASIHRWYCCRSLTPDPASCNMLIDSCKKSTNTTKTDQTRGERV